jgi:hypothetical protein
MSRVDASTKPESGDSVDPARDEAAASGAGRAPSGTNERDSLTNDGAESAAPGDRRRVLAIYGVIAVITLAVCSINALSQHEDISRFGGRAIEAWKPFVWEWTSGLTIIALTPMIRTLVLWSLAAGRNVVLRVLVHVGGAAAFLAGHLAGIAVLRKLIYWAVGAGPYNFVFSAANILYEARKDAILYALLAGVFWAASRLRLDVAPEPPRVVVVTEGAKPRELWLRDGTTSVRVDADDIVWVASAGNYIEYCLTGGMKHLIRGTLTGEEERLARFGLVRVHRTRLVNAARIRRVTTIASGGFEAEMDTGEVIAGSRSYRARVNELPII